MAIAHSQTQNGGGFNTTGGATTAMTTAASGSIFMIGVGYDNNSGTSPFTSVSDSKSNSYTQISSEFKNGASSQWGRVYACVNGTGGASHTATLNIAAGASTGWHIFLTEITGAAISSAFDTAQGAGITAGSTIVSPTITATAGNRLIYVYSNTTASNNPATLTFDNSIVVPTNGSMVNGTTSVVGGVGTRVVTSFSAAVTASYASASAAGMIIGVPILELVIASGVPLGTLAMMGVGR